MFVICRHLGSRFTSIPKAKAQSFIDFIVECASFPLNSVFFFYPKQIFRENHFDPGNHVKINGRCERAVAETGLLVVLHCILKEGEGKG